MQTDAIAERLTARQQKAILALLTEDGVADAAREAGVKLATLWRWQKEPAFLAALLSARREAFDAATTRIAGACADAAEALRSVAADAQAPATARVSAARAILDHAGKALELHDLAGRLEALEKRSEETR